MEKFWKVAITISGLGAIGAFVFWSLYKQWLTLPIFSRLDSSQTFVIMLTFLGLTFLSLLAMLLVYFRLQTSNREAPEGNLELIDVHVNRNEGHFSPYSIDFKLANRSNEVAFVKRLDLQVLDLKCRKYSPGGLATHVPISYQYDMLLNPDRGKSTETIQLSQAIGGNDIDRFEVMIGSWIEDNFMAGKYQCAVFTVMLILYYDSDKTITAKEPLMLNFEYPLEGSFHGDVRESIPHASKSESV